MPHPNAKRRGVASVGVYFTTMIGSLYIIPYIWIYHGEEVVTRRIVSVVKFAPGIFHLWWVCFHQNARFDLIFQFYVNIGHVRNNRVTSCKVFHGPHTVAVLSGPTYLEIKWSCYGEAVARLQGLLCCCHSCVCAAGAGHLIFVIMMN